MHIANTEEYLYRSSKKKKNILFKLASEFSQSPDKSKGRKGKDSKKKAKSNHPDNLYKAFPGFAGDCSGNRMNTEATDDLSLNSGRNRAKQRPVVVYNDMNEVPTITLDDSKTPDSRANRTITNEFDYYNKSRNEDAITCKRDCSKYSNLSDGHIHQEPANMKFENQMSSKMNYLHKSNENMHFDLNKASIPNEDGYSKRPQINENYGVYFDKAAAPLEEIARVNPSLIPLLKLVRKGYEDACQKIIIDFKSKTGSCQNDQKVKEQLSNLKHENSLLRKDKDNLARANTLNDNLYKKNSELQKAYEEMKAKVSYFNKHEKVKINKLESENKELKSKLEKMMKKDYDILQKLDLDEYNLTSDDLRSETNKKK